MEMRVGSGENIELTTHPNIFLPRRNDYLKIHTEKWSILGHTCRNDVDARYPALVLSWGWASMRIGWLILAPKEIHRIGTTFPIESLMSRPFTLKYREQITIKPHRF